ncbi:hypothetical protein CZ797_02060 [Pseudoalteromonas sp. JB197]|nr:hypothetical protein CZ797_02060 [Pseudoalteromonas sp. JB197]
MTLLPSLALKAAQRTNTLTLTVYHSKNQPMAGFFMPK